MLFLVFFISILSAQQPVTKATVNNTAPVQPAKDVVNNTAPVNTPQAQPVKSAIVSAPQVQPTSVTTETDVQMVAPSDVPNYKKDSTEYKILQLSLDIESTLNNTPVTMDAKDEDKFLVNIPLMLRPNFKERMSTYPKLTALKGKVIDADTGYVVSATDKPVPADADIIKMENDYRKEQFDLMTKYLAIPDSEKDKVAKIYAQAIKNQKYYMTPATDAVVQSNTTIQQKESSVVTSMTSKYELKKIWEDLIKLLNDEKYLFEKGDINTADSSITCKYKCTSLDGKTIEERSFLIKLCTVKESKLFNCKNEVALSKEDQSLYSYVSDGTVIWIEKPKDPKKTLLVPEDFNQDIKFCPNEDRKFNILEKLSSILISKDPTAITADKEQMLKQSEPKPEAPKPIEKVEKKNTVKKTTAKTKGLKNN